MIDRMGGMGEQFLDEQSFNQELLLMKLGNQESPVIMRHQKQQYAGGINRTQSTLANTNSHKKNTLK
jgi:hypothetical protein